MNAYLATVAVLAGLLTTSCGSAAGQADLTEAPTVEIPPDRSLDISYVDDSIVVSFEQVGFAHRSMQAELYRELGTEWKLFGHLVAETADVQSGRLVLAGDEPPVLLDGVLVREEPDVYDAVNLAAGRYAACASLIDDQRLLCGEFRVGGEP